MKKLQLTFVLLLIALLVLSACAQAAPTAAPPEEPAAVEEEPAAVEEEPAAVEEESAAVDEASTDTDEPVNLVWANWLGAEDAYVDDVEAMIAAFQEKYPHITIESVPYPFNQAKDQLIVTSTGGNPPDISMSHPTWVAALVEAGVLQPLDDLLLNKDDYFPSTSEGKSYDGNLMAATWAPSPIIIYYNKNLLEQAGWDGPPETWGELLQASRDIAALGTDADGNTIYGMGISSQKLTGTGYFFLPWMWNAGGEFVDADGNVVIDSPENVQAFADVKALFDEGVTPAGLEIRELRDLFAQGLLGFHWDGEFGVGIFASASPKGEAFAEDYGIMLIPGDAPGQPGPTFFVEHDLVIYKDSPHQEEAALFLDFLTGPEGIAIYNEHGGAKLPARASVAELPFYDDPANTYMAPFIEAMEVARPMPVGNAAFLPAMEEVAVAIQQVGLNDEDPADVAKQLDQRVKELYGQ